MAAIISVVLLCTKTGAPRG